MDAKDVVASMDGILKPRGFRRHKATWNRKTDSFLDVIDLQSSKAGNTVTINAGVAHPEIHKMCWNLQLPAVFQPADCIAYIRIGDLLDRKDLWWHLDDAAVLADTADKLITYILPFLDRMHSFATLEQFLNVTAVTKQKYPPPIIYLAILKEKQGDHSGA